MQIKTTIMYHHTPVRMAGENGLVVQTSINIQTNAGQNVKKTESSYTIGLNVNWHSHYGEQYEGSLKN